MKTLLKKLSSVVLALAVICSLTPVTGSVILADEAETEAPAAVAETEPEKKDEDKDKDKDSGKKDPDKSDSGKPKETEKAKEEDKGEPEEPKAPEKAGEDEPKETEKAEPEAEAPKETKKAEADVPEETDKAEPEAPKETEKNEADADEPKETEKAKTGEPEADADKESGKPAEEPAKSITGTPKDGVIKITDFTINIKNGVLTWNAVNDAATYEIKIADSFAECEETTFEVDSQIDAFIAESMIDKAEVYPIIVYAYDSNGFKIAKSQIIKYSYSSGESAPVIGTLKGNIDKDGNLTWNNYASAECYIVYIEGYEVDTFVDADEECNVFDGIDTLISSNAIDKAGSYKIRLCAYNSMDSDNNKVIAQWSTVIPYNSNEKPGTFYKFDYVKLDKGILRWERLSNNCSYEVNVSDGSKDEDGDLIYYNGYSNTNSFKLYDFICQEIKTKDLKTRNTYYVKLQAIDKGSYAYVAEWNGKITLQKIANPLSITGKKATVKYKKLKKKQQTLSADKVIQGLETGRGNFTFVKKSGNKKIKINKKTGKVTIKKGLKKGTYKVRVQVKASGNQGYNPSAWKTVTIKIKVK